MREGKSGASASLLTQAQRDRIDAVCKSELEGLGSDFPYDEVYGRKFQF